MNKNSPKTEAAAFPDEQKAPAPADIERLMHSKPYGPAADLHARLAAMHPDMSAEWKYSQRSGWYEIPTLKKRRLFYFAPKRADFRVNLVLGDRAIVSLAGTAAGHQAAKLVKTAPRYPEGTLFSFDRQSLDPELVIALIEAKLRF